MGLAKQNDERLLVLIARGKPNALAALYDRHERVLYSLARRILGPGDDAGVILREIFVSLWQCAPELVVREANAFQWLVARTRERCGQRPKQMGEQGPDGSKASGGPAALALRYPNAIVEKLTQSWQGLPDDQREAIELAFFEGMNTRQIAERAKVSADVIKGRLRDGLGPARDVLGYPVPGKSTEESALQSLTNDFAPEAREKFAGEVDSNPDLSTALTGLQESFVAMGLAATPVVKAPAKLRNSVLGALPLQDAGPASVRLVEDRTVVERVVALAPWVVLALLVAFAAKIFFDFVETQKNLDDVTSERNGLQTEVAGLSEERDGLQESEAALKQEKAGLEKVKADLEKNVAGLTDERQGLRERLQENETARTELQKQLESAKMGMEGLQRELADAKDTTAKLTSKHRMDLEAFAAQLREANEQIADSAKAREELAGQLAEAQQSGAGLQTRITQLQAERDTLSERIDASAASLKSLQEVWDASQIQVCRLRSPDHPDYSGFFLWDTRRSQGYLKVSSLPILEEGQSYRLWLYDSGKDAPLGGGDFEVDASGGAEMELPDGIGITSLKSASVTLESEKGAEQPAGPKIIGGER